MKSILIITSSYYPVKGGLQNHIRNLVASLKSEGYSIKIATGTDYFPSDFSNKKYWIDDVEVIPFKTYSLLGLVFLKNPLDLIRLTSLIQKAEIVHQHDIKFLPFFFLTVTKLLKRKIYLSSHGFIFHTPRNIAIKRVFMKLFRPFSKFYNQIICVSENDLEIAEKFNLSKRKLIDQAINLDKFLNLKKNTEKGNFLYYGRIAPNKGIPLLIKNLAKLHNKEFHLNIIGKGDNDYVFNLKQLILKENIPENITIHGEIDEIILLNYISKAEIIFLPSYYEGFGITLLESLATSTKVLANHNRSYNTILKNLQLEDLLFDYNKSESFENKLNEVLKNEYPLTKNLSIYSYKQMINNTIETYHD